MSRFARAALCAALMSATLPAVAGAATADTIVTKGGRSLVYTAAPGEINNVRVSKPGAAVIVDDQVPIKAIDGCRLNANGNATCLNIDRVLMELRDGNDVVRYEAPTDGFVEGGAGNDLFVGGLRELTHPDLSTVTYFGGEGAADKLTYAQADRGVSVTLGVDVGVGGNDGRPGERENVEDDIENFEGSRFNDSITGSDLDKVERFTGGAGNDTIAGLGGTDLFDEGATRSGSDTYNGGAGIDLVDYSRRSEGVEVSLDPVRDDGAPGELDFVDPNVNDVFGGAGPDVITGNAGANVINGHNGSDFIIGSGGDDRLIGGGAFDQLFGDAGNDVIEAQDNAPDRVRCGGDADTVNADLADADSTGCEVVNLVGTLGLTPKALRAEAGEALRMKLSWTHPEDWKKLSRVSLRLRSGDDVVGRVVIEPGAERMSAGGAVRLLEASRLSHRGGAVTARLALELAPALAGRTLKADVAASDVDGRSQVERGAATIRVTRGG
jgi:Ca2+-binding RTX toxin-like protein